MTLSITGVVFGPLIMMLASVFLLQKKGRRIVLILSGILFFFSALYQLIQPFEPLWIHVPQILWKLLALVTAAVLFLLAVRDKHYGLSVLLLIQILALILTEILLSPNEPAAFLQFGDEGKLILAAGAFIIAIMLPVVLSHPDFQKLQQGRRAKAGYAGIFLWMAAFAGILCARSITGLFLFAQWGYLGNLLLRKAFGEADKRQLVPVLQQAVLTLWVTVSGFLYLSRGTPAISDLAEGRVTDGLLSVVVVLFVFILGVLIPEKRTTTDNGLQPVSVMGLSMVLFSLLIPFSVLLQFRPLFLNLDHRMKAPVVFLGALLMAANAYYASTARKEEEFVSHLVLFVSGWALFSAFMGLEDIFFSVGYIIAAALALSFLFACSLVQNFGERSDETEPAYYPVLTGFKAMVPMLFILPPFSCALPNLFVIPMLKEYGLAALLTVTGFVLLAAVIVRWTLPLLQARKTLTGERKALPGVFRYILPVFFVITAAVNLLSGPIYRFLLSRSASMEVQPDPGEYAVLSEMFYSKGLNTGIIYLGISAILLVVLYIASGMGSRGKSHGKPASAVTPYSLTAWLPAGIRIPLWIRAAWITAVTLLVGVALSCLVI